MRAILTYHSIDRSGSPVSVQPEAFQRQVAWLAASEVEVVPLGELLTRPQESDACAITFDDAFFNFQEIAWPELRSHELPVTLFVVSGHTGGTNAWGGVADGAVPTLPLMDWDALGLVAEQGVALGAHTHTHPRLPSLADRDVEDELSRCKSVIEEQTGARPTALAYPYGDVDDRVATVASRHFSIGVTTRLAPLASGDSPLELPRLDAYYFREGGRLQAWGTPSFERYLAFRRGLRGVRRVLSRART